MKYLIILLTLASFNNQADQEISAPSAVILPACNSNVVESLVQSNVLKGKTQKDVIVKNYVNGLLFVDKLSGLVCWAQAKTFKSI
jgi:hypothetical protein